MLKKILPLIVVAGIILFFLVSKPRKKISQAIINGNKISLIIADTPSLRNRGLSYRKSLPRESGMLFLFDKYGKHGFWMYEMNFPLDFLWIRDDIILDFDENVPLETNGKISTVEPIEDVNKVLEINSGIIKEYKIKKGDKIIFK